MGDRSFGRGWPSGIPASKLTTIRAARSGAALLVHREIAPLILWLLDETERRGYLFDLGPKDPTDDWGYSNRPIGGTNQPSEHSWATAVDLDATQYPQGQTKRHLPQWVIDLWAQYRFENGLKWGHADPMHMEFHGTVTDARWLIAALAAHSIDRTPPAVPPTVPPVAKPLPIPKPIADQIAHALAHPAPVTEETEPMILRTLHFKAPRASETWLFCGFDREVMPTPTHVDAWIAQGVPVVDILDPVVSTALIETTRELVR